MREGGGLVLNQEQALDHVGFVGGLFSLTFPREEGRRCVSRLARAWPIGLFILCQAIASGNEKFSVCDLIVFVFVFDFFFRCCRSVCWCSLVKLK